MPTQIIKQAFDNLNPGGWLECQELDVVVRCDDGTMAPDNALGAWAGELVRISALANKPLDTPRHIKGWLADAGFVDVQEREIKIPTCAWPEDRTQREMGWWMEEMLAGHIGGLSRALQSRVTGLSAEAHEVRICPLLVSHLFVFGVPGAQRPLPLHNEVVPSCRCPEGCGQAHG